VISAERGEAAVGTIEDKQSKLNNKTHLASNLGTTLEEKTVHKPSIQFPLQPSTSENQKLTTQTLTSSPRNKRQSTPDLTETG